MMKGVQAGGGTFTDPKRSRLSYYCYAIFAAQNRSKVRCRSEFHTRASGTIKGMMRASHIH